MKIKYEFINSMGVSTWPQDFELTEVLNTVHVLYAPADPGGEWEDELTITMRLKDTEL